MSTEAYVRDSRFEVHGCAIKHSDKPAYWLSDCLSVLDFQYEWQKLIAESAVLMHHAHFDGLILSHHYGIVPRAYLCTLSMARMLLGNHVSNSLDSVREHFGMPVKRTPYHLFKGKHWQELDAPTRTEIASGACDEVESIWQVFNAFMHGAY